jgi:squalene cyclase
VRFEQVFVLYVLHISGLLNHPDLQQVVSSQVANLAGALRPGGLGLSDYFAPDGDDTAAALTILRTAGYPVDLNPLRPFTHHDHFWAYPGELHGSVSLTARCISARALFRAENSPYLHYILERQQPDGRWLNDKWHSSWLYTTCHAIIALRDSRYSAALGDAVNGLVEHQQPDGRWGTPEETGYAIFALRAVRHILHDQPAAAALGRAEEWMLSHHRRFHTDDTTAWIGKELYRPQRIVRAIELAASIPSSHLLALPISALAMGGL